MHIQSLLLLAHGFLGWFWQRLSEIHRFRIGPAECKALCCWCFCDLEVAWHIECLSCGGTPLLPSSGETYERLFGQVLGSAVFEQADVSVLWTYVCSHWWFRKIFFCSLRKGIEHCYEFWADLELEKKPVFTIPCLFGSKYRLPHPFAPKHAGVFWVSILILSWAYIYVKESFYFLKNEPIRPTPPPIFYAFAPGGTRRPFQKRARCAHGMCVSRIERK